LLIQVGDYHPVKSVLVVAVALRCVRISGLVLRHIERLWFAVPLDFHRYRCSRIRLRQAQFELVGVSYGLFVEFDDTPARRTGFL
jgi:hypothetical protein